MVIKNEGGYSSYDEKQVYVTALTNENYIPGVMALVRSLKKVATTHEIIILVPTSAYQFLLKKITDYGILYFSGVNVLSSDDLLLPDELNEQEHFWTNTFFKLKAFSLEQFSKVILIDSDMLVQKNIDCLFEKEHMSAVVAGKCLNPEWCDLNSGLVVFVPNVDLYKKLVLTIPFTYMRKKLEGAATGDQDVIHDVFPEWRYNQQLHLDEKYNMFWSCLIFYCTTHRCKLRSIPVVHFIGAKKPWSYGFKNIFIDFFSSIKHLNLMKFNQNLMLVKYILLTKRKM